MTGPDIAGMRAAVTDASLLRAVFSWAAPAPGQGREWKLSARPAVGAREKCNDVAAVCPTKSERSDAFSNNVLRLPNLLVVLSQSLTMTLQTAWSCSDEE